LRASPSASSHSAAVAASAVRSAENLFEFLVRNHWNGSGLVGPDCGIRFNYRAGRFVKSYLRMLPWRDSLYYLQGQAYWILATLRMHEATSADKYRDFVEPCSNEILRRQTRDGAWSYPNREWNARIATAEGTWASLGLLAAFRYTGDEVYLNGALRWHGFLERSIGFQQSLGGDAVNYFAGRAGAAVPNNTAFFLRFLADLANATGDSGFLERSGALIRFLTNAQKPSGEFPYTVAAGDQSRRPLEHFQCFQYNAFACLDLLNYRDSTGDPAVTAPIERLLTFLASGVGADGHAQYSCQKDRPRVTYHTSAVAAAFACAAERGWPSFSPYATAAYCHVLSLQRSDGSFPHSSRDYGFLADVRSYPRNLAMMVYHLSEAGADESSSDRRSSGGR
jgi:uncharacterized protein YyaL (SSP411 family)